MKLYRFSPIRSEQELTEAIEYVAGEASRLSVLAVGEELPITYMTIFAHYNDEYERLTAILESWGEVSRANNGVKVKLRDPLIVGSQRVSEIRIRQPDPYRMQVGCCDYSVSDYQDFKAKHLGKSGHLRLISRPEYEMIEFFDPDFDILAYVVSP